MCSNVAGHMTMLIYGEKLQKSSSSEWRDWWPWNLVYSIGYSSTTNVFIWWPLVDGDHFYDMVKFVSECFYMSGSLYSIECSCISKFVLIQHILSTLIQDQWSSGLSYYTKGQYPCCHLPSLIRVFAVCLKKAWVLSYPLSALWRLWSAGWMPRLIWVFAGCTTILLVLSWGGSNGLMIG